MKNILVTIDFDINTDLLLDKAADLARAFESKVWFMHIAAPDPEFVGFGVGPQYVRDFRADELRHEHKLLQEYTSEFHDQAIEAEGLLIQGPTIEMIIDESKKLNIDLIITGHHEHGFFYNAFAENVSAEVIKKSKIPVLIIPLND